MIGELDSGCFLHAHLLGRKECPGGSHFASGFEVDASHTALRRGLLFYGLI